MRKTLLTMRSPCDVVVVEREAVCDVLSMIGTCWLKYCYFAESTVL